MISWSRYREQLDGYFRSEIGPHWSDTVSAMHQLLRDGESIDQMMQVTGEEGISIEDYVTHQKALFLDMVYLQQDAYDPIDVSVPMQRQVESFELCRKVIKRDYSFETKEDARKFFLKLTGLFKNLNTLQSDSNEYLRYRKEIEEMTT